MTRSDLVEELAARFSQLTHRDAEFAVKAILDAMSDALVRGHRIEIRGFGSFSINRRPPRIGRNPRSGESVAIPEKRVPHFKPGKALREAVDRRTAELNSGKPESNRRGQAAPPSLTVRATGRIDPSPGGPMKKLLWLLKWMLKAAIFFTLFAFALNNQQDASVHFFFGTQWRAPLVLVVLAAFTAGVAIGVLGMVPRWWKHRKAAQRAPMQATGQPSAQTTPAHPAEHGL
ncbi:MAG: integration host factor subunit beta [Betaproteobacteria bacterium]|nr:integration host factor subunit beta [Betaproteobacteria bacterium]